jgi:hypothetical protein
MAASAAPAALLTLVPFATPSADIAQVTLSPEDAAISGLLETTKLERVILGRRTEGLERAKAEAPRRADHLDEPREQMTEALKEREHRMWSAKTRPRIASVRPAPPRNALAAAETREWEAKARLVRVRAALDEPGSP